MFSRTWSRGGRGRCADVDFVVWFWCVGLRAFFVKLREHTSYSTSSNSRDRTPRPTYAQRISRHVFGRPRSRWGGAWLLRGLHNRHIGHITFDIHSSSQVHRKFPELRNCVFKRVCFGCGGLFWVRRDFVFFRFRYIFRTHTDCCKYEGFLPNIPLK